MPTTRSNRKSIELIQAVTRGKQSRRKTKKSSQKNSSPRDCPICLEKISKEDISKYLCSNKHKYHKKCIRQWMKHKTECPLCRENLLPNNKKQIEEILNDIDIDNFIESFDAFTILSDTLLKAAEYNKKKLRKKDEEYIELLNHYESLLEAVIELKTKETEIDFLSSKIDGVQVLKRILSNLYQTYTRLGEMGKKYIDNRILERKIGEYNLELLEKPTRFVDIISRPLVTERAKLTRKIRSH